MMYRLKWSKQNIHIILKSYAHITDISYVHNNVWRKTTQIAQLTVGKSLN